MYNVEIFRKMAHEALFILLPQDPLNREAGSLQFSGERGLVSRPLMLCYINGYRNINKGLRCVVREGFLEKVIDGLSAEVGVNQMKTGTAMAQRHTCRRWGRGQSCTRGCLCLCSGSLAYDPASY